MSRREQWRKVLDAEVQRWLALSYADLPAELQEARAYEVEFDSKTYQVEIELVENTGEYVHVSVAVDDGSLPGSILPSTRSFIRKRRDG
jgi:hypothetical protein